VRAALALAAVVALPAAAGADEPLAGAPPPKDSPILASRGQASDRSSSEPDSDAVEAGDANLEPAPGEREGITITFAVGGALTLGIGMEDATGRGGAGSLRLGRVATRRTLITLELTGSALFHGTAMGETAQNRITTLQIGAQYFARDRLWVRMATGYASYVAHDVLLDPMTAKRGNLILRGAAGTFGIGIELVKIHRRFGIQLEAFSTAMINRDGLLSSSAMLLGATFD
jgi:hypothetical protein